MLRIKNSGERVADEGATRRRVRIDGEGGAVQNIGNGSLLARIRAFARSVDRGHDIIISRPARQPGVHMNSAGLHGAHRGVGTALD